MLNKINSILYYTSVFWVYKMIFGKIGNRTRIFKPLKIENPSNIFLGKRVYIGSLTWLASVPITGKSSSRLEIGDGCYIGNFNHIYCTDKIIIGKKVMTADKVYISDNLHDYEDVSKPVLDQKIIQLNEVIIGDGTWIGENCCIIGSHIGKNCVIGANSVVNKDIPDYCVAVGSPAKIIKRYCFEKQEWLKTDSVGNFIEY